MIRYEAWPPSPPSIGSVSIVLLEMPGQAPVRVGVLLEDPADNRLYLRFRRDWDVIAPAEAEVLSELESDLAAKAQEMGASRVLDQLQDTLSNTLTISAPREVMVEDFGRAARALLSGTGPCHGAPFCNAFAALFAGGGRGQISGKSRGREMRRLGRVARRAASDAGDVCRAHRGALHGAAHSRRQPVRVPRRGDGFARRPPGAGGIPGRRRRTTATPSSAITACKRQQAPDGSWEHEIIRLEPLNPEFEAWELTPEEDRFRIVAEFVQVLY